VAFGFEDSVARSGDGSGADLLRCDRAFDQKL